MKKILASTIISIFLVMVPFFSFAMTAISENELDNVTAEAGVTLDFSGTTYTSGSISGTVMVTDFFPSLVSWGDSNGFTGYTSTGWAGYAGAMGTDANIIMYNAMTLDVGSSGTETKLFIGLPSILVHAVTTDARLRIGYTANLTSGFHQYSLGNLYNDQFALIVNPSGIGNLTISNHSATNTQGIEMAFSNFYLGIPNVPIILSWGDAGNVTSGSAGFTNYTNPGYFGVKGLVTSETLLIALSGTMSMDVGTNASSVTVLNLVLPSITINPGLANIIVPVAVGSAKDFSDAQPLAGTLDIRGFSTNMTGSMQIYSH